jgi:hypothetical protein
MAERTTNLPRQHTILVHCLRRFLPPALRGISLASYCTPLRLIAVNLALILALPQIGPPQLACAQQISSHCTVSPADTVPQCGATDTRFSTADVTDIYAFETRAITDYSTPANSPCCHDAAFGSVRRRRP